MKVRTSLFSLLLASQVLPWTVQSVHAQTYDAQAAQREDDFDARQLQNEYRTAYTYVFKMPAYSVDEVTETSKTLGDGNQVSSRQSLTRYRDRNGRVKIAYKTLDGKERTLIADPIARTGYLVRPNRQDILRVTGEHRPIASIPRRSTPGCTISASAPKRPSVSRTSAA